LLGKNTSARERLSFLGAGCWQHYVPAVCDEINSRGEFLTAYAGEPYEDKGRFQALFEYESMMGELLNMDVVNVPNYDGFQAAGTALLMARRITRRSEVLICGTIGSDKLSKVCNYIHPHLEPSLIKYSPKSGLVDLNDLNTKISANTAAVFFENPSYLGFVETQAAEIADITHQYGALCVVYVDPISLGVLNPPVEYGGDIVCGDIQSLGMHMWFGGGHGGFIATRDDPTFVLEFPSRLFGVSSTIVDGEYGFGDVAYERTSFAKREEGKEWVGTASALWGITAGVYLALMGPQGMVELGESIAKNAMHRKSASSRVEGSIHRPLQGICA
jgi:glycine dehydrogenase subunit 1